MEMICSGLALVFSMLLVSCRGFFWGPDWSDLQVTFGFNPFNSNYFADLPRTTQDAVSDGFVKVSDCDVTAPWRGSRYVKGDDWAVVLLFDVNGYIAGIQAGIPKDLPDGYPSEYLRPPFVDDGDHYVISAYFVDPSTICNTGRTAEQFEADGTGTNLYIQNSSVPENSFLVPKLESELAKTMWTEGRCFYGMGNHYWHNIDLNSECEKIFPAFLLYNDEKLNAFGWGFFTTHLDSPRLEHPPQKVFGDFVKTVPTCMENMPFITTMHIYFDSPINNFC